ncbi:hypothetical protein HMSSN036_69080 [Paenibacillus macerans]|nr:hypothetical protein HMSSN036_69080 [Paenibacillus macerans]
MIKDKTWLAGITVCIVILVYLFIGFARYSGKIGSIVQELRGNPASGERRYHIVLIEQERYHPYWEMVEKRRGPGGGKIRHGHRIYRCGAQ